MGDGDVEKQNAGMDAGGMEFSVAGGEGLTAVKANLQSNYELIMKNMLAHKEGFKDAADYLDYVKQVNGWIAEDYQKFLQDPMGLRLKDPENPQKFRKQILIECADGRNSLSLFIPADKLLGRFDLEWLPFAGNIIFPELTGMEQVNDVTDRLAEDEKMKKMFFERLDFLFGPAVDGAIKEYEAGKLGKIFIEFQSHFDSHSDHHGCGAHKSDLAAAQLETIKDCLIAEQWLKDRHPVEYQKHLFKVFRTTHDTGENGHVYRADKIDREKLSAEARSKYADLLDYSAKRYESPVAYDEAAGIVKKYHGNPMEIATEEHDEQTIRVSSLHQASTLTGQSVMEISWTDSPVTIAQHLMVLLGIIEKNYRARHPEKPAIIHFDLVKDNEKMAGVYRQVKAILDQDEVIQRRKKEGTLIIVTTETDRDSYRLEEVQ